MPLALIALLVVAVPAEGRDERTCARRGSETIRADGHSRVFRDARGRYFACRYGGRPLRLPVPQYDGLDTGLVHVAIAGMRVAYAVVGADRYDSGVPCRARVVIADLGRRSVVLSHTLDANDCVAGLALSTGGEVVFSLRAIHNALADASARIVLFSRRTLTVIDAGDDIDPTSLARTAAGRRVYWLKGGEPRSRSLA